MTDKEMQELDAWLAENVMDWKVVVRKGAFFWSETEEVDDRTYRIDGWDSWHPTTNIAQAFEVVEKMKEQGYYVEIGIFHDETECYCTLVGEIKDRNPLATLRNDCFNASAKTPALAICLVAKKAKEPK